MAFIDSVYERARGSKLRIALPECGNEKMMAAAGRLVEENFAIPVIVGDETEMRSLCQKRGFDETLFEFADTANEAYRADIAHRFAQIPGKMLGEKAVMRRTSDALSMALVMEEAGDVDITFAGLDATTAEVIMAAQMIVGLGEGIETASSFGIFELEDFDGGQGNLIGFGDSAICLNPSAEELASIAISCCDSFRALIGRNPRCAMLSYSTDGSGAGPDVDRVREAVRIAQECRSDLDIDGEFQMDAAVNQNIGAKKVKRESKVAGRADLIIWPDINVGNIGIKLVQQFARCKTYGPLMQGFAKPVCDCSRGDDVQALVDGMALAVVRTLGSVNR